MDAPEKRGEWFESNKRMGRVAIGSYSCLFGVLSGFSQILAHSNSAPENPQQEAKSDKDRVNQIG